MACFVVFFLVTVFSAASVAAADNDDVYDFVVVGGGSAALTIVYTLVAQAPDLSVLLLEAGDDLTPKDPEINIPLNGSLFALADPTKGWGFKTQPQANAGNRVMDVARFKGLGGCSQHNGATFWLASGYTYDAWPRGWQSADFLKAAQQLEGFDPSKGAGSGFHGTSGPLYTELDNLDSIDPFLAAFKAAAGQAGFSLNADGNDPRAAGYLPYTNSIKDGQRFGPYGLLQLVRDRPNLTIKVNHTVTRLLFAGQDESDRAANTAGSSGPDSSGSQGRGRAVVKGVRALYQLAGQERTFRAKKGVVVSAGAVQSPQLLMVSGIGDPAVLQPLGIPVRVPLPGVGKSLRDHYGVPYLYMPKQTSPINTDSVYAAEYARYLVNRTGYFAYPFQTHGVVRTAASGNPSDRGDVVITTGPIGGPFGKDLWFVLTALVQPRSSGSVSISSGNILDKPLIDFNYFGDPEDYAKLQKGLNITRRLFAQPALANDWAGPEVFPGALPDAVVKGAVISAAHPMGTCRMGTDLRREPLSVVDSEAAVHGTKGLWVMDASVIPTDGGAMPDASPHATVIVAARVFANKLLCKYASVCL